MLAFWAVLFAVAILSGSLLVYLAAMRSSQISRKRGDWDETAEDVLEKRGPLWRRMGEE